MWISWRSIKFETIVAGWVAIISVSLTLYHFYLYIRSLLARWASRGTLKPFFSFLWPWLPFLHLGWGPLMYMHALLGKSQELQTYKPILSFLLPSPYHPVCSILLSSHFHSLSCFYHYLFHLISHLLWVDDSSHLSAKRAVISLHSSHHLALIRRF